MYFTKKINRLKWIVLGDKEARLYCIMKQIYKSTTSISCNSLLSLTAKYNPLPLYYWYAYPYPPLIVA